MATIKFKDQSPYMKPKPMPSTEDYLYRKFETDLNSSSVPDKKRNVALFGIGRAGTIHLSSLVRNPRVNLSYIVDDDISKHEPTKKHWGLEDTTRFLTSKDMNVVFKDQSIDAVVVASPTFTHQPITMGALQAKKAVFCEKPIAETKEAIQKCYEQAKRSNVPLFCAFNRRFDPSYRSVHDRVRRGDVGHVHTIKVCSRDSPLPSIAYLSTSGGIFHDCSVHDIDIMCWILGELPVRVSCLASSNVPEIKEIDDFDTVCASLLFPSGTVGIIDLSRNSSYGYDQRLEVFGPRGMVSAGNEQPMHCLRSQLDLTGVTEPPIWYSFASRYKNAYLAEMEHFLNVVSGKEKCSVNYNEVIAVTKIATAIEKSARSNEIVELKWLPEEISLY